MPAPYALSTSRASSLKFVYSKQPIIGLTQEFCVVAFETIKLIHAKVLCAIFDINYHPNIAHINMQGASILVLTYAPTLDLNYCDRQHILITFIYIITPLLTSTNKPVLARASSRT